MSAMGSIAEGPSSGRSRPSCLSVSGLRAIIRNGGNWAGSCQMGAVSLVATLLCLAELSLTH